MEPPDKRFSEFVKSWIPWRSEPSNVSRDFWMPDKSCRVCYECDSQFTVFNRRHHCRLCGRVFCAKCTINSVLVSSADANKAGEAARERIRVCNYCFKRWEQEVAAADNGTQLSSTVLSPSVSAASLGSTKSSGTGDSITTAASILYSTGAYSHAPYCSDPTGSEVIQIDLNADKQDRLTPIMDSVVELGDASPNRFGFCINNRSDDDDDGDDSCHFDLNTQQLQTSSEYYGQVAFDEFYQDYQTNKIYPADENTDVHVQHMCSSVPNNTKLHTSLNVDKMEGHDNSYELKASSTIYGMNGLDADTVDFENNNQLWQPPEPEDEEDEREPTLFDDDDDDDAMGEWGHLCASNSFGSGKNRSRDRASEEHKKAVKNVVDGHFRALIAQLLQVDNLSVAEENNQESWLEIITSLSWEAATLLKPDTSKGGGMDPGGYVKVKCIASGRRRDSMVVKGVVCKKNVAHRRMPAKIEKPRFLILGGALEYQRMTNTLSSVDTLLQQEMDHLKMAVAKIAAHQPNVLLVEKSVSRFAQDYLLAKNISLVLNIKRALLERIARCTGAQIVPSVDHLSSQKLGYCDLFHVEKFFEEHGSAGHGGKKLMKTLMFFEGCPKPLGCTILLKGANEDELKKVKHVVQYGVFAAYHLALETSFLADEGASLPELPLKSPITVALPDKPSCISRSISTFPSFSNQTSIIPAVQNSVPGIDKLDQTLITGNSKNTEMTGSPGSSEVYYSLASPMEEEKHAGHEHGNIVILSSFAWEDEIGVGFVGNLDAESFGNKDQIVAENYVHGSNKQIMEMQPVPSSLDISHLENNGGDDKELSREDFSTSDHQSILVSLSSRCIWKGTVCERAHLFRIKYYGSFDKPLGRFLRDNLFDESYWCRSCELPPEAHVHCYTHRQGSLTISVRKQEEVLPGERDGKIWMWHRCLRCPRINGFPPATRRVVMSDAAWGLSFGKFLELSFSNNAAASRVASCGHSLHRDCLRFYGFGRTVACFRYASVNLHSVCLPPSKLDFNYQHQEWIQKEADEVAKKAELLFTEVLNKLHQIAESKMNNTSSNDTVKVPESRNIIADLEGMLQKEKDEFKDSLHKVTKKEPSKGQLVIDILEINKLRRQLLFLSYFWDQRLICAANSCHNQEVLGSVIAKSKGSTDKISDINLSSKPLKGFHSFDALPSHSINDELMVQEKKDVDPALIKQSKASSISANGQSDQMEFESTVRRIHSEGQFLAMTDLSNTFDARWIGENGPTLAEASMSNWIEVPFSNLYRSINKDENTPKVDVLNEYKPVYVSLFWGVERQGGARLLLPIGINDIIIPVYDDEPTSIISYALVSSDYNSQMLDDQDKIKESGDSSLQYVDDTSFESLKSVASTDDSLLSLSGSKNSLIMDPLAHVKAFHPRVSFSGDGSFGKVKYSVTCYYAKRFEALRQTCCPSELHFIRSLSRCKKWGAQGGKSNVFFAKSLDDRFIIKQVTKTELESFITFASEYFKYLSESISTGSPTCLAKILGIYQITIKNMKGGKESRMDVLVMENLLFGRNVTKLYDLKGSLRSRYNPDSSGQNKVLLDQNLIEAMPTSPIFLGNKAKRLLERAVWNDTAFLASIDVMDYSLLVGMDEEKHELVLGIIDFMRQYTWDKHLETWVKASGILGGPRNESPTVISPKQYKKRFRKAMSAYFLVVPDQWSPSIIPSSSQAQLSENVQRVHDQSFNQL